MVQVESPAQLLVPAYPNQQRFVGSNLAPGCPNFLSCHTSFTRFSPPLAVMVPFHHRLHAALDFREL
eukprot:5910121-Pyramimonas_sp.AAC.1